jgi:hypothetical protein
MDDLLFSDDEEEEGLPSIWSDSARFLASIMFPLCASIIISTLLFSFIRYLSSPATDVTLEIRHKSHAPIPATPALFGPSLSTHESGIIINITSMACGPQENSIGQIPFEFQLRQKLNVVALVSRGECAFDEKVYWLQQAGFDMVIVYNNHAKEENSIRMAPFRKAPFISIPSMFITNSDGSKILEELSKEVFLFTVETSFWDYVVSLDLILVQVYDATLKGLVTSALFLLVCMVLFTTMLLRNRIIYNSWQLHETLQYLLFEIPIQTPKLSYIHFPIKVLTSFDVNESKNWSDGGVCIDQGCAICLEEFMEGHSTRELPCRHTFHDQW